MKSQRLIYYIVGCLLIVSVAISLGIVKTLYDETIDRAGEYMSDIALTSALLINAIAVFDESFSKDDNPLGAYGATLEQIESAFRGYPHSDTIGEILFVRFQGQNIEVVVHQEGDEVIDHSVSIDGREPYAQAIRRRQADDVWTAQVEAGLRGKGVMLAVAPVERLGGAVVVETSMSVILAPFFKATVNGFAVAIFVITFGTIFVYRQSRKAVEEVSGAQAALSQSLSEMQRTRDQLSTILDAMQDGFVLYDAQDRLVYCNTQYEQIYKANHGKHVVPGATFEEILRAGVANGEYPGAAGREEEWLRERMEQHRNPKGPFEQKLANGRWLRIVERRAPDGGTVGFRSDITELKEKEFALRDSEQRFKDFSETASDWAWETDAYHRFVYLSAGLREENVFEEQAALGKARHEVSDEDTSTQKWRDHWDDLQNHRPFHEFEYSLFNPKGLKRIVSASGKPVFDTDGKFLGYRGTGRDITVLREQQDKLEKAEQRFRLAFDTLTVGIVLADRTGAIKQVNPETTKIFGYTAQELVGQNVRILMPAADSQRHDQYINSYLTTGIAKIIGVGREVVGKRKTGESIPVNLGIAEMQVDGELQFLASIVDMSREKALEGQLRQAQKMESVGQLVGGIAHDFNNILGIVIGNLDLVKRKLDGDEKLYRQVEKAIGAANRGASLTRRLLNFSRQTPTQSEAIDINDNIRNIHELLQRSITKSVEIKLFLDDSIPRAVADPGDFQDALVNLAVNARDAMPNGGVLRIGTRVVTISNNVQRELKQLRAGQYVEVDVADTGSGMSHEVLARIFDPFYTTKETGKGTGLGLPMVYGFARRSGGAVSVYSEPGVGSSFKLFLPVAEGETVSGMDAKGDLGAEELPRGTETILVVDDEEDLADVAAAMLEELGYTVIAVHSGVEAMEVLVSDKKLDLMLSDVVMPGGISGYELADVAEQVRPEMKVCLASGYTGDLANGAIRPNESYPFLGKPYDARVLAVQLRQILDSAPSQAD